MKEICLPFNQNCSITDRDFSLVVQLSVQQGELEIRALDKLCVTCIRDELSRKARGELLNLFLKPIPQKKSP